MKRRQRGDAREATPLLGVAGFALLAACSVVNVADLPEPPDFEIVVEPDTVRARLNAQQRIQIDLLVRIFNHGPGMLFMPDCGHELHRAEPNGTWTRVYTLPCRTGGPPFAIDAGGGFGYLIRIISPVDSGPWRRGAIGGRYKTVSYISTEFRAGGAWGRPISLGLRTSPAFPICEEVP